MTTMLVQRYLAKDSWGASVAKGLVMGIIAGVPFQVTGTAVGIPLLAWAGCTNGSGCLARSLPQEPAPEQTPGIG